MAKQSEAFDVRIQIQEIDPRKVLSPGTTCRRMWAVHRGPEVRYVYEDRHGLYDHEGTDGWAAISVRQFLTR